MGAGNRYTLTEDSNILAAYVDTSCDCWEQGEEDCYCHQFIRENLISIIETLPLFQSCGWDEDLNSCYYGEMYKIVLESGNHEEIVINLEFQDDFEQYGLQQYNYEKVYHKIIRHINKEMKVLNGHGYTSTVYEVGEY